MIPTRAACLALAAIGGLAAPLAMAQAPSVDSYVGKYPFDKVQGVSFLSHPAVRAAVTRAVANPQIRGWLLDPKGSPSPQITRAGSELVSTGCQQHACDRRNWAILFNPATKVARVCYFNGGAEAGWYDGKGGSRLTDKECPS